MKMDAKLSNCKDYRYYLTCQWDETLPFVNFIGLNPATADASKDDYTIKRCVGYAKKWGYGGIIMTNLFAYRTKSPTIMMDHKRDKVGKENDKYLLKGKKDAALSIAAWGNDGTHEDRWIHVTSLFDDLYCLKVNITGQPTHPSRSNGDLEPIKFTAPQ